MSRTIYLGLFAAAVALAMVCAPVDLMVRPAAAQAVAIDNDDIGGTVTGPKGPEAGVWVIAETNDLPTNFIKIVVTDDHGRYVIPDLPTANYQVWARGYGLVDSPKLRAKPGQIVNHTAVAAPNDAAAAHYYPAIYWYAMLKIPPAADFGGHTDIPQGITQTTWIARMKNVDCVGCHQLGNEATRTIPAQLGNFATHDEAWIRRVRSGQFGEQMTARLAGQLGSAPYRYFGDWTSRVAKGELPFAKPKRPQGVERNVVISSWAWSTPDKYLHDLISSDRRNPTVNAYGRLYGSPEYSTDMMPILDPKTHTVTFFKMPVRDANMPLSLGPGHAANVNVAAPSPYWGDRQLWDTRANNHNAMFDERGRLWNAASVRDRPNPDWCKAKSDHPSAKLFPLNNSSRQLSILDPKTMQYTFIDTCFGTHHLQFDKNNMLWVSGSGPVAGWLDVNMFDATGDAIKSQGWAPFVLDTNGNGKRDEWTEPGKPMDPDKDMRVGGSGPYAVMPNPADGSVWYTFNVFGGPGGGVLRYDPKTQLSEFYHVPMPGYSVRGGDIDSQGVLWVSLGSGHLGAVRSAQVQGPAQRTESHRRALPRGLVVPPVSGTGLPGHRRQQRRGELLHLGRSAQRGGARPRRADLDRQSL